jgi:ribosomal protein S18 acetylase RimI-like enzyme
MTIHIREFHPQDHSQAIQLWKSLPGLGLSSADQEKPLSAFLSKNASTCFVAEDEGRIIGTILGGSDGRRGYIYHLAVQADRQHRGLGSKLTQRCLDALKNNGIEKCHIFVIADNQEGKEYWRKIGWKTREDIIVMSKDLK